MDESLKFLVTLIDKGGPTATAAIMAVMWWLERRDRVDAQKAMFQVLERVVTAMEGTASAIREFRLLSGKSGADGR